MAQSSAEERFKILPLVAMGALVILCLKTVSLWTGVNEVLVGISTAQAGGGGGDDKKKEKEEPSHSNITIIEQPEGVGEGVSFGSADFGDLRDPALMSETEVKVLQNLAERRETINKRDAEVAMKEKLLAATEKRVQERIDELKALEARIQSLMIKKDEEKEAQIASLVKVYESMKAKDAARIFENLDKGILLAVTARMKEGKVAAVLAQMNPKSAQNLTVMLAHPDLQEPSGD